MLPIKSMTTYIITLMLEFLEKSLGNYKQLVVILAKHVCVDLVLA